MHLLALGTGFVLGGFVGYALLWTVIYELTAGVISLDMMAGGASI
jgi:hypothetical protein